MKKPNKYSLAPVFDCAFPRPSLLQVWKPERRARSDAPYHIWFGQHVCKGYAGQVATSG